MTKTTPRHFHAGWMLDGDGGAARRDQIISVQDGRIDAIRPFSEAPPPEDLVDLSDCTVLPGLVDTHLHLAISGANDPDLRKWQLKAGYDAIRPMIDHHMKWLWAHGVMAVRDAGDHFGHALRYRDSDLAADGHSIVARACGRGWHARDRYGKLIGGSPGEGQSLAAAISQAVSAFPAHGGPDHVKVVNSGINSLKEFGKPTPPQFDAHALGEAVAAAGALGLPVMVHANSPEPVAKAIAAGCESVEHGFFMGDDNLGGMADACVVWVPTACTMSAYADCLPENCDEADIARRILDHQVAQLGRARQMGTPVALGTDAGSLCVYHGAGVIDELRLLMDAGYTVAEAIHCATAQGARLLNLPDFGRLAPGMADGFIAVPGSPAELPASLGRIRLAHLSGRMERPEKPLPFPFSTPNRRRKKGGRT